MRKRFIFLFSSLVLLSLACRAAGGGNDMPPAPTPVVSVATAQPQPVEPTEVDEPEDTEVPPATETSEPTEAPEENPEPTEAAPVPLATLPPAEPGPDSLDLSALLTTPPTSDFSEQFVVTTSWTDPDGSTQEGSTTVSYQAQTQPAAAWNTLLEDNNPFFPSRVETTALGESVYVLSDEFGCQAVEEGQYIAGDPRRPFLDLLAALTGEVEVAERDVDYNGLTVDEYTLDVDNILPESEVVASAISSDGESTVTNTLTFPLAMEGTTLESASLYLAQQGGFVAGIELAMSKTASEDDGPFFKPGTPMERSIVYSLVPAAADETPLAAPEGCEMAGSDTGGGSDDGEPSGDLPNIADIPRMDDASNVIEMEGTLMYDTGYSLEEVFEFYVTEMEALGWEKTGETTLGNMGTLDFMLDEYTMTIMLIDNNGTLMVTIAIA